MDATRMPPKPRYGPTTILVVVTRCPAPRAKNRDKTTMSSMFVTRNSPIACSAGAMKSMSGSFLRSLGQSQRWLSVGATSGPSARKGSVRGSTLARSWLDWVAAAGLFDGGQVAFLAELQERDHEHAGDR